MPQSEFVRDTRLIRAAALAAGTPNSGMTMPPPLLLDLSTIEADNVLYDRQAIYGKMPHRHEFMLLDAITHLDRSGGLAVAYRDCMADQWWARGHIPDMPIFPGVLQLEAGAQLTAFMSRYVDGFDQFIAFGGVDNCRFREAVYPPSRLYIIAKILEDRRRRVRTSVQGVVSGRMVFESEVTGMVLPKES